MCLYPQLVPNPKYKRSEKNQGIIPAMKDKRIRFVPIGCGNCMECRKQKAREWQTRLSEDIKVNKNGKFITLTFSNESIKELDLQYDLIGRGIKKKNEKIKAQDLKGYDRDNAIATLAVRYFLERWRKRYGTSLRHWLVTELGHEGTENIHLHGIVWTDRSFEAIEKLWQYGFIWPSKTQYKNNYVSTKTVNYIVKYINKIDNDHKYYKPIMLTSAGIGSNYINSRNAKNNKFNGLNTDEGYVTSTGHKISLPIYLRNKLYSDEEREKLWIQKLDKQERYINGERVSIKNGYDAYDKILKHYRKLNAELGYGDQMKQWKREKYENDRRDLLRETRIKNAKK